MTTLRSLLALLLCLPLLAREPVDIIFDTDMGNDIDDALALAIIHQLADRGALNLLAVTSTKDHPLSVPCIDALNTFYGRPDVPIGAVRDGVNTIVGNFLPLVSQKNPDGKLRYPHDLRDGKNAPESVSLLREILAKRPAKSVTLIQVGFSTNFSRLLDSPADEHSPLSGRELITEKVRELILMAGSFKVDPEKGRYGEYNIIKDLPAARNIAKNWPTPALWTDYQIGMAVRYPNFSIRQDYDYLPHHPLKDWYLAYCNPIGPKHDRPTWDLTAVLQAAWPDRGYFDLSEPGRIEINDKGHTIFTPDPAGAHRFFLMNEIQQARVHEAFLQLCPAPPRR
ncbi:MAG: nucleoside hydrolase [Verrucomicrobiales bacterium]